MVVKRIVLDVATQSVSEVQKFYSDLFELEPLMDMGWVVTMGSGQLAQAQVTIASTGGSDAPVPDVSIEVDDVDATYARAQAMGCAIEYDLTDEPWGVRRFFLRDPAGKLLNVLAHVG